jgi:uncharacterized membrane protein
MASSKTRSRNRPATGATRTKTGANSARGRAAQTGANSAQARTAQARTAQAKRRPAEIAPEPERPAGPPPWLQVTSLVLAIIGLGVSVYETWAHFNGSHLAGCPTGHGTFNCSAVITSPQSMVFGVIPVAILGLLFYVFVVAIMTPWAWQMQRLKIARLRLGSREVAWLRLGSMIVGMGFVVYLLYAELYQIGEICEYCTGVHVITFLLFAITVVSAATWGLGKAKPAS